MLTFLWCVPRSVSTAFEKMMYNAGRFDVISEPFLDLYKQSLISKESHADVTKTVREMCDDLLKRSEGRLRFVKDMAYHAEPFITDEFIKNVSHAFLIRNPKLSVPSLYRMRKDYDEAQTGFEGQLALFNRVKTLTDSTPMIIDAEQLIAEPASIVDRYFEYIGEPMPVDILSWPVGTRDAWTGRESWHVHAINSKGFEIKTTETDFVKLPRKVANSIMRNMPFYLEMHGQINASGPLT